MKPLFLNDRQKKDLLTILLMVGMSFAYLLFLGISLYRTGH